MYSPEIDTVGKLEFFSTYIYIYSVKKFMELLAHTILKLQHKQRFDPEIEGQGH